MDKDRFKLLVTYNGRKNTSLRFFWKWRPGYEYNAGKPAFKALHRISDHLNDCYDNDIIEIALALGIPVKFIPEHKPRKEPRYGLKKLNGMVMVVRRA